MLFAFLRRTARSSVKFNPSNIAIDYAFSTLSRVPTAGIRALGAYINYGELQNYIDNV